MRVSCSDNERNKKNGNLSGPIDPSFLCLIISLSDLVSMCKLSNETKKAHLIYICKWTAIMKVVYTNTVQKLSTWSQLGVHFE